MVGAHSRCKVNFASAPFRIGVSREEKRLTQEAMNILGYLGLATMALRPAAGLPFGTLKRIELARAMAAKPRLLLLDEPASGLTHAEVDDLGETIRGLRDRVRSDRAARRAPHAARDGDLRQGRRARLRTQDRRGHARRRTERPERDRGVPREQSRRAWADDHDAAGRRTSTPAMGRSKCSAASTCTWTKARSSSCSVPTAREDHDDPGDLPDGGQQGQRRHVRYRAGRQASRSRWRGSASPTYRRDEERFPS